MSVVERGVAEREQRELEKQEREARWREENRKHTISWFRQSFYRNLYVRNPDRNAWSRLIPGPDMPEVTEWKPIGPGDTRAASSFVCEGIQFICRWDYKGSGGDRAYWDDGWWPDWFVVVRRPRFFGLFMRREEIQVWGPQQVAEALGR